SMGMLYSSSIRSLQGIIEPPVRIHIYEYLYHFMREAQQTPSQQRLDKTVWNIKYKPRKSLCCTL
ncbi:MAG: hypothetical protein LBQ88_09535, partial [Treponema sp.]|nr:hypothetical protein [Treponema sp.]